MVRNGGCRRVPHGNRSLAPAPARPGRLGPCDLPVGRGTVGPAAPPCRCHPAGRDGTPLAAPARSASAPGHPGSGRGGSVRLRLSVAVGGVALAGRQGGHRRGAGRLDRGRRPTGGIPWCPAAVLARGDPECERPRRPHRAAFRARLGVDDATWTRGRGWALTTGLNAYVPYAAVSPRVAEQTTRQITEVLVG